MPPHLKPSTSCDSNVSLAKLHRRLLDAAIFVDLVPSRGCSCRRFGGFALGISGRRRFFRHFHLRRCFRFSRRFCSDTWTEIHKR